MSLIENKNKVWIAQYSTDISYSRPYEYWQYTSSGRVNGITGNVDCNFWYYDNACLLYTSEIAAILIAACVFGAPLRASGVIDALLDLITTTSKSPKSMAAKVYAMCLTFFVITGGYDLTYAALGPMLPDLFDKYHLHRKNLSRIRQDCTISLSRCV